MKNYNGFEIKEGTKIYYTGDMANEGAYGVIVKDYQDKWGEFFNIELEDGRKINALHQIAFAPGCGRRFMSFAEYQDERQKKIMDMQLKLQKRG
jgi:major membrane immunogen (membrane-anchored lipoprotein)